MNAQLMLKDRRIVSEDTFVDMVVWRLPFPVPGSRHRFKYRLALVVNDRCVLRYDNEQGKGDHKHIGDDEMPFVFTTIQDLLNNFWHDVDNWRP